MIELIGAIATMLAVCGVVLNNRKLIACFYFWLLSNSLTAGIHFHAGLWSLLVRDLIFAALAVEGLLRWRKGQTK
ncbi:MAG TPA: nicotinamide mononucleotide transporter [Sedimentisphaerales bacterium]|nr:nicotinamide mononucleotide transporter [Sedimentisphaerales bacterium]